MNNNKQPHLHDGHRKRKREQLIKMGFEGLEHFPEHEPLEFLLYYAIPRSDTNALAKTLIKEFGSLANVINADYHELLKIKGIGESAATLISFFRALSKLYLQKNIIIEAQTLSNSGLLKDFCQTLFIGVLEEEVHCIYLTDDLKLITHEKICTGKIGTVDIPTRKIARSILSHNCARVVVTHNHPAGTCIPSKADVDSTRKLQATCNELEAELIDHIIVARDGVMSLRENRFVKFGDN
ncbi:MAG: DNA repair protein RadC [Oscillospiraceae bacterium]|nr:DNA repair protein RadC [Oscillospiraceae bacterium]